MRQKRKTRPQRVYLIGWLPDHGEIRHWKITQIVAAELTEVRFTPAEGFELHQHLAKSFGVFRGGGEVHVKVRFSAAVARYVQEAQWHISQRLTPETNGSLLAEFTLDGTEEIKRWLLSFGRHAVVLEPASLREERLAEVVAKVASYSKTPLKPRALTLKQRVL